MRLLLACLIAWTDWATSQQPAIGMLVFLTLLAWPSDALDGPSARWAADRRRTWQGAHDLEADLSVALAWTFTLAVLRGMPIAVLAGRCSWARAAGWRFLHGPGSSRNGACLCPYMPMARHQAPSRGERRWLPGSARSPFSRFLEYDHRCSASSAAVGISSLVNSIPLPVDGSGDQPSKSQNILRGPTHTPADEDSRAGVCACICRE